MRIAVITGSRGDRGALEEVYHALDGAGHSMRWIDVKPWSEIKYPSDAAQTASMACSAVAGELAGIKTDMVVLLGDRYEIAGAALGANIMGVPIAHLSGGDVTAGSPDDYYRDSITALSHLHFPTNQAAARRLEHELGINASRITVAGSPCLDKLARTVIPGKEATFAKFGLQFCERAGLVLLHPDPLGDTRALLRATSEALRAIGRAYPKIGWIFIGPNADPGNELIWAEWEHVCSPGFRWRYHDSVEQEDFWALMSHCDVLVGNSSAGRYEAPSMAIPVVEVGDRQEGREPFSRLYRCRVDVGPIEKTIRMVLDGELGGEKLPASNPYGDGHACERIVRAIGLIDDPQELLRKRWHSPEVSRETSQKHEA